MLDCRSHSQEDTCVKVVMHALFIMQGRALTVPDCCHRVCSHKVHTLVQQVLPGMKSMDCRGSDAVQSGGMTRPVTCAVMMLYLSAVGSSQRQQHKRQACLVTQPQQ